jgi:hypothetical protein
MRRRALISAGGVLLASGCTARLSSSSPTPTAASFDGGAHADRVVVAAGDGNPPVRLTAERDVLRIDPTDDAVETLTFTLVNRSSGQVSFDPGAWRLYRQTTDEWEPQHAPERDGPAVGLDASETFRWVLAPRPHPSPNEPGRKDVTAELASDRYAFAVTVDIGDRLVECVARFGVRVVDAVSTNG